MWYPARIETAASVDAVSLTEAKAHCRIDGTGDDASLALIIKAACDHVEKITGTRLATQTLDLRCNDWADLARLSDGPVQSVTSVKYLDLTGTEQTLSTDVYEFLNDDILPAVGLKYGQEWPVTRPGSRITVRVVAGFGTVPAPVKQAILQLVGHWFENREAVIVGDTSADMPMMVADLLINYRRNA